MSLDELTHAVGPGAQAEPTPAPTHRIVVDGNEAAARVAHKVSEVIAIYPITPASTMGELADAWRQAGTPNLWGDVPDVIEMQSEGGAAGAVHGAIQTGALTTSFTASQGLLLMIPNLYKIAGELSSTVIHVAARAVATHALSIFGDHSDVMAARQTGMALLSSASVQEAQDLALIAHAATLEARVPFLHFFDGFRTSHEVASDRRPRRRHHRRHDRPRAGGGPPAPGPRPRPSRAAGYGPEPRRVLPVPRGGRPLPPGRARHRGPGHGPLRRPHRPPLPADDYTGHPEAERVLVLMGSAAGPAAEVVETLAARGERVGLVTVHLYRPFDVGALLAALPPTARRLAVLDRTKEPGAVGEPLYLDVVAALAQRLAGVGPDAAGGRRPLRPGLEGVHPGHGGRRARRAGPPRAPPGAHRRHRRRRGPHQRRARPGGLARARRRLPGRVLRPGQRRHGGGQQELGEDHRRPHRPLRPGLLRLRLEEVGLDHRVAPALRPPPHPGRLPDHRGRLRGVHHFGSSSTGRRAGRRPGPGPPC